jgi:cyclopropane fatty-acyl-phospholipid synthase-like methyltransferase
MIHERGYWLSTDETSTHVCDIDLTYAVIHLIKDRLKTIIDIGCGNGEYTRIFLKNGFACIGLDGSPLTPELSNNLCKIMDFSESVDIGKFDLVFCLEVGEHIPSEYEQTFIDNICRASKNDIILSWAVEGQGGTGHVNERNNDYVIKEMSIRGFEIDNESTNFLRKQCKIPWFKGTIMYFKK